MNNTRLEHARNGRRDPIPQFKYIGHNTVEPVGPYIRASLGFDELASDAQLLPHLLDTALEDVTGAEPLCDVTDIHALPLEVECGAAGDHEQGTEARQGRRDFLHNPVREPFGAGSLELFWNGSTASDGRSSLPRTGARSGKVIGSTTTSRQ